MITQFPESKYYYEAQFRRGDILYSFKHYSEAIRIANATRYGLSSSIYSNSNQIAMRAVNDLEAGMTYVNGPTIGAEVHLPFGGVKDTGSGHREVGPQGLDVFSEWKTVYIDYSGALQKAQMEGNSAEGVRV